jgi:CRP/FNR family cyclic AMP-dependent transcriptional regulator
VRTAGAGLRTIGAMVDESVLGPIELFADLDSTELARLAAAAQSRRLFRNDILFSEGDTADEMFVMVNGRVAIANRSPEGRESLVALMEAGDVFGEMGLFLEMGRSAQARALEPSQVVAIPYGPVREIYEARPSLLWGVVRLLAGRVRSVDEALADAVFLDVTGRTAKRLLELAGEADEFVLPVTQEELAGMVGASRERVNKAIAAFVRLGWIEQSDRRYRITDRRQLTIRAR